MDITHRKKAEDRAKYLSFYDQVTKVFNRTYAEKKLKEITAQSSLPLGIIIGDVNGLKLVNDAFGHEVGDRILKNIARVLKKSCGPKDIVARWGGDEFLLLIPNTSEERIHEIAEKIKTDCLKWQNHSVVQLSISLGCALKRKLQEKNRDILSLAEERMYREKLLEARSFRNTVITSLEATLRQKDYETEEHAKRLIDLSKEVGRALHLNETQLSELALLAALHDIGKLGIPDEILNKPGPLDEKEWQVMKRHCEIGYRIAISIPELAHIAEAILAHHERWDGGGYPRGLAKEEIPILSRILAIVDSFDVMTHSRPYKKAKTVEEAIVELKNCAGTQFDPNLVEIFLATFIKKSKNQGA